MFATVTMRAWTASRLAVHEAPASLMSQRAEETCSEDCERVFGWDDAYSAGAGVNE